jgi:hypothetical protein
MTKNQKNNKLKIKKFRVKLLIFRIRLMSQINKPILKDRRVKLNQFKRIHNGKIYLQKKDF